MPKDKAVKSRWRVRRDKGTGQTPAAADTPERRAELEAERRRSSNAGRSGNPLEKGMITPIP